MDYNQTECLAIAVSSGILLLFFFSPQVSTFLMCGIPDLLVRTLVLVLLFIAIMYLICRLLKREDRR